MKNPHTPAVPAPHKEDREIMAAVIAAIGRDYSRCGMQIFLSAYETNNFDLAKEGLQLLLGGGGLSIFAPLIQNGSLTVDQLLNYLDKQ